MGAVLPYVLVAVVALLVRRILASSTGRIAGVVREVLLIVPVLLLYFLTRGFADARPDEAQAHAQQLIRLEQDLGIFHERDVQRLAESFPAVVDVANWIYIFGHWPVIATVFVWLAYAHADRLPRYRNAIVISGTLGILIFLTFPVAPPRFMPTFGFSDTILTRMSAYRLLQPKALSDLYAAMPSLHVGWNLLMGIAVVRESSNLAARLFGAIMPAAMYFAVVATANHYILDGLAGAALVTASLLVTDRLADRRKHTATV